jgi:ABC-type protease/lipase transport system fused ATPase/permease subunit
VANRGSVKRTHPWTGGEAIILLGKIMQQMTMDRVRAHTASRVNEQIDEKTERRIVRAAGETRSELSRRIDGLDAEWDMERWLETNASALAFTGTMLGLFVNKKFLAILCIVLPFLFQHAVQGWCPPIPILRRKGVRTRREIDAEKYALKALRGDFSQVQRNGDPSGTARAAWRAVNA